MLLGDGRISCHLADGVDPRETELPAGYPSVDLTLLAAIPAALVLACQ